MTSTFGYSLAGGYDLDKNDYPDFVVGAYQSNKVVVMRSRPVVTILATLSSKTQSNRSKTEGLYIPGEFNQLLRCDHLFQIQRRTEG